jgi:uncharacterized membrane protein (UPF0127 family)
VHKNAIKWHKMNKFLGINWIAGFLCTLVFATHNGNLIADPLLTYPIIINGMKLRVEVANEPETRAKGLMNRSVLANDRGMIFVFPSETRFSIWMKNTPIDLTVIFANKYGRIINIEHMTRNTLESHSPASPAMFAIEISQESLIAKNAKPGDLIWGLEHVPSARN